MQEEQAVASWVVCIVKVLLELWSILLWLNKNDFIKSYIIKVSNT